MAIYLELRIELVLSAKTKDMLGRRRSKHIEYIHSRLIELHNSIGQEVLYAAKTGSKIDPERLERTAKLMLKYRRRIKLIKL